MSRVRFNEEYNWIASGSMDCSVIIYDYDSNRVWSVWREVQSIGTTRIEA